MDIDRLVEQLTITHDMARQWCGMSPRQWRRYRNGDSRMSEQLVSLIQLRAGQLGAISPQWIGWRIQGDELVSPVGQSYSLKWFHGLPWYLEGLRAERARLRQRIRELEANQSHSNVVPFRRQKKGAI